jgi:hypothetical protein
MPVTQTQRNHLVRLADLLNQHAALVKYAEVRPMSTARLTETQLRCRFASGQTITCDCSEAVTLMFRLAGLKDPNGLGYDGEGYTGTMLRHLPHFSDWTEVHEGTLIVFGDYPGNHVVMVVKPNGENPMVYSHGSYSDHAIWDLNTERGYQGAVPITLLSIADL